MGTNLSEQRFKELQNMYGCGFEFSLESGSTPLNADELFHIIEDTIEDLQNSKDGEMTYQSTGDTMILVQKFADSYKVHVILKRMEINIPKK